MKTFKQFLRESSSDYSKSTLSFPSSFGEVRGGLEKSDESILSWDSSFREHDKPNTTKTKSPSNSPGINEAAIKSGNAWEWGGTTLMDYEHHTGSNSQGALYNKEFHHHPDVEPQKLSDDHKEAIKRYVQVGSEDSERGHGSSANMNGYLRNLSGEKEQGILDHHPSKVRNSIKQLSSTFTPENTNKVHITTYGGIPEHIGRKLATSKVGSGHTLAGFTSTSTSKATAKSYGEQYNTSGRKSTHVIKYNVEPGAGLSVAPHSRYSENEVTLHHGAHVTYHGSERHRDEDGHRLIVHNVTVHPHHKPLDDYGKDYTHPIHLPELPKEED